MHLVMGPASAAPLGLTCEAARRPRGRRGILPEVNNIPLTIVGGYLGSGKTTLLNHLLRQNAGRRLAIVVNDFGSVSIDAALVAGADGEVLTLVNGCVCCSISAGFAETLTALSRRTPPPEHVVVESSGVSDPAKVALYASLPPYRLDGIVVVADAEGVRELSRNRYVGESVVRQLRGADLIVLNKMDLTVRGERSVLLDWLRETAPQARVLQATYGRVPLAALLGPRSHALPAAHASQEEAEPYQTWTIAMEDLIEEAAFRAEVESWPARVLRAKGFVHLAGDPRRHLFQLVGKRWSLVPDGEWSGQARTEIVLIAILEES